MNFSKLDSTKHMFQWLFDDPYEFIWNEVEVELSKQVQGAELRSFLVSSDPDWLTVGNRQEDDTEIISVSMSAVAFEYDLEVWTLERGIDQLSGVFTWAATNLGTPDNRKDQLWFDIGGSLTEFGQDGNLEARMRSLK